MVARDCENSMVRMILLTLGPQSHCLRQTIANHDWKRRKVWGKLLCRETDTTEEAWEIQSIVTTMRSARAKS